MSTNTTHGALMVLDLFISTYVDGQVPDSDQVAMFKTRADVAELVSAGNAWCDLMPGLAGVPEFDRLVAALVAVGELS